jgi:type IV secretion system protein VirD4
LIGAAAVLMAGCFALRVAIIGNAAFVKAEPKRIRGRRALHGEAEWMSMQEAAGLFPASGGIVIGERYRVDRDDAAAQSFRSDRAQTWGLGGRSPLLCLTGRSVPPTGSSLPAPAGSRRPR